jgi:glycosyltransferase involved in cell wall biosynthesis
MNESKYKTAIVHEWFVNYAGSEKCVESFLNIWKDAYVFSLVDFLSKEERNIILKGKFASTSFIQNLPFAKKHFRNYLPLFPLAIEQIDLSGYDLIISSSHSVAKGVLTKSNQLHICYCHTPMRYAWDLYHQYIKEEKLTKGIKGFLAKLFLHKIRIWDSITANRVDYFIANSNYTAGRIKKIYNRGSKIIYPPVDVDKFECTAEKENFYVSVSRLVPYKKVDLVVEAFSKMKDKKLIVIGDGPDMNKIKSKAAANIEFLGYKPVEEMKQYLQRAKAFVFASEEDFGITVIESLACGTPVIAFNKGGSKETIKDEQSGIHFNYQTVEALSEAVVRFERIEDKFDHNLLRSYAENFSRKKFEENISKFVNEKAEEFFK